MELEIRLNSKGILLVLLIFLIAIIIQIGTFLKIPIIKSIIENPIVNLIINILLLIFIVYNLIAIVSNRRYYTKDGCPLCDEGLAILCTFDGLDIECIDIEENDDVYPEFAVRIPVIRSQAGDEELAWPFDREDVKRFIEKSA